MIKLEKQEKQEKTEKSENPENPEKKQHKYMMQWYYCDSNLKPQPFRKVDNDKIEFGYKKNCFSVSINNGMHLISYGSRNSHNLKFKLPNKNLSGV